jgi:hypothetical protein
MFLKEMSFYRVETLLTSRLNLKTRQDRIAPKPEKLFEKNGS